MLRKTNKEMTIRCQDLAPSRAETRAVIGQDTRTSEVLAVF